MPFLVSEYVNDALPSCAEHLPARHRIAGLDRNAAQSLVEDLGAVTSTQRHRISADVLDHSVGRRLHRRVRKHCVPHLVHRHDTCALLALRIEDRRLAILLEFRLLASDDLDVGVGALDRHVVAASAGLSLERSAVLDRERKFAIHLRVAPRKQFRLESPDVIGRQWRGTRLWRRIRACLDRTRHRLDEVQRALIVVAIDHAANAGLGDVEPCAAQLIDHDRRAVRDALKHQRLLAVVQRSALQRKEVGRRAFRSEFDAGKVGIHRLAGKARVDVVLAHLAVAVVSHRPLPRHEVLRSHLTKHRLLRVVVEAVEDAVGRLVERHLRRAELRIRCLALVREVPVLALQDRVGPVSKLDNAFLDARFVDLVLNDLADAPHHVAGVAHGVAHLGLLFAGERAHRHDLRRLIRRHLAVLKRNLRNELGRDSWHQNLACELAASSSSMRRLVAQL